MGKLASLWDAMHGLESFGGDQSAGTSRSNGSRPHRGRYQPQCVLVSRRQRQQQREALSIDASMPTHTRFVELRLGSSDRPNLQSASKVVSGGRSVGSKESVDITY